MSHDGIGSNGVDVNIDGDGEGKYGSDTVMRNEDVGKNNHITTSTRVTSSGRWQIVLENRSSK